jgi:protein-S-isoprenylcysteine O-methyltransferase Ste14
MALCSKRGISTALVSTQFGAMAGLAWLAFPALSQWPPPAAPLALLAVAALLGAWALHANRPGNFNVRPIPRAGGALVQRGPYRWIRHPMYSSVGCFGGGCVIAARSLESVLAMLLLVAVLVVKSELEERWMAEAHPGYAAYRHRTWRFVPWVL